MKIVQRVACKAIIVRDGRILLMRESAAYDTNTKAGLYQFPGGRVEPGEPFMDGLLREIQEETAIKITIGKPFHIDEWMPTVKGQKLHIVAIFFVCEYQTGEVRLSEEHDDFQWVNLEEVRKLNTMVPDNQVAEKFLSQLT